MSSLDIEELKLEAYREYEAGNYQRATNLLLSIESKIGHYDSLSNDIAVSYFKQGDFDSAINKFREASELQAKTSRLIVDNLIEVLNECRRGELYNKINEKVSELKGHEGRPEKDHSHESGSVDKVKYFCVGRNKTGTTSLKAAFEALGYVVGNQHKAEMLTSQHYFTSNFQPILDYCKSAQVFQDVPFSYPKLYKQLDQAYPGSKFILTVRDSPEQWYSSITRFHAKLFGKGGRIPTVEDLKAAQYVRPGFMYNVVRVHGTPDEDPYNKEIMIAHYESYNREIMEYFSDRPEDLLVINVAERGAYEKFIEFLGVESPYDDFPWLNKT